MKRKHVMFCCSEEEQNRQADILIEKGYRVEREIGVIPIQPLCYPTYKIIFWE